MGQTRTASSLCANYALSLLVAAAAASAALAGCARDTTVRSEQTAVTRSEHPAYPATEGPAVVDQRRSSTTTTVRDREDHGFLGSVVHFIGEALALPFRLVGGLIDWIF